MADLLRNLNTEVVHRPGCTSSGSVTQWNYAIGRSMESIELATCMYPWLHLCKLCMPDACRCKKCVTEGDL